MCQFTLCVYSNLSISSRAKQRHYTTLVLPPLPQIAPVSPQWSLCARGACFIWVSTRLQSANHHPQTLHTRAIFFCLGSTAIVSGHMCTCDAKRDTVIKCQMIRHNDHYHHPISHTHRLRQVAVKDMMIRKFTVPYLTQTPPSCGKGCVLDSNFYNLVHKEYKSCLISVTKKIISWTGFLLNLKFWHMDKDSINQT